MYYIKCIAVIKLFARERRLFLQVISLLRFIPHSCVIITLLSGWDTSDSDTDV